MKQKLQKFWNYIWKGETLDSYIVFILVSLVFIKFVLFPSLGFIFQNDYPVVAIVSESMEHDITEGKLCGNYYSVSSQSLSFEEWWDICGYYYPTNLNISQEQFLTFDYVNGLYRGDVMVLYGKDPEDIQLGEVLVFVPEDRAWFAAHGPVIHRVVDKWVDEETGEIYFTTKGDHNEKVIPNFESTIPASDVIGVPVARIPYIGYVKLFVNELFVMVLGVFK